MRAISIKQPWVHGILHEGKDIENRTWRRDFRGWLVVHASASRDRKAEFPRGCRMPDPGLVTTSAVCGIVRVVDIVERSRSKWYRPVEGKVVYGWVLADPIALERPIHWKGALGLWEVPKRLERLLREQLPARCFAE